MSARLRSSHLASTFVWFVRRQSPSDSNRRWRLRSRPRRHTARWLRPWDSGRHFPRIRTKPSSGLNAGHQNLPSFLLSQLGLRAARRLTRSCRHKTEEMFVNSGVVCQFRMKGGRHNLVPLHQRGLPGVLRENFDARASALNDRATNENHFQRFLLQFRWAADHVARDLPPVGVPQHSHIQQFQGILPRIPHFRSEQYSSGARPEYRSSLLREFPNRVCQALLPQELQLRRALATRQNQAVAALKMGGSAHLRRFRAQPRQHRRVRLKVSLHRQNPDLHFNGSYTDSRNHAYLQEIHSRLLYQKLRNALLRRRQARPLASRAPPLLAR